MNLREELESKLLSLGGSVAHVNDFAGEQINSRLISDGLYFNDSNVVVVDKYGWGLCHNNAIFNWLENKDKLRICTGFAMDSDAWYRHTWCVDEDGVVYECTPGKRKFYYGLPLNEEETNLFMHEVLYPHELEQIESDISQGR